MSFQGFAQTPASQFFSKIQDLCGSKFVGKMTFPLEGQDSFKDKILVADIDYCSAEEVRIPFSVGEDASRTWILSQTEQGLRLKHKHLLKDGTIDPVSDYGGFTIAQGTGLSQSFYADDYTKELIPDAATNVWTMSFSDDFKTMTYHLERHAEPRFSAVLEFVPKLEN